MNMMSKCAKFHADIPCRYRHSFPREWLNFRRRPILHTVLYRNPMPAPNFGDRFWRTFPFNFFCGFSHKIPLFLFLIYTMMQKSQKWPKSQIRGGGLKPAFGVTHFFPKKGLKIFFSEKTITLVCLRGPWRHSMRTRMCVGATPCD